ncbi:MAG: GtrA family protein [Candidatus Kerfeldbacteria bacterium]|nr:GtrA family protein [Candidatus Kerfeldbacteria bacterium]
MIRQFSDTIARLPVFSRLPVARQFVKFGLVGVTNTLWDFLVYLLLTRGWLGFHMTPIVANGIAFVAAMVNSYILNKRWTFRDSSPQHHIQFTKFSIINLVTLALYELLFYIFHQRMHLYDIIGKLIAVLLVMIWNFSANRYWTFKNAGVSSLAK